MRKLIRKLIKESLLREGQYKDNNIRSIDNFIKKYSGETGDPHGFDNEWIAGEPGKTTLADVAGTLPDYLYAINPSGDFRYTAWLARHLDRMEKEELVSFLSNYGQGGFYGDISNFIPDIARGIEIYHDLKTKGRLAGRETDFENMSIQEFMATVNSAKDRLSNTEKRKKKKSSLYESGSIEKIYEDNGFKVIYAKDNSGCQYVGQGSTLCIGATNSIRWYSEYSGMGFIYYFVIRNSGHRAIVTYDKINNNILEASNMGVPGRYSYVMKKDEIIDEIVSGGFEENQAQKILEIINKDAQTRRPHLEFFALHSKKKEDVKKFERVASNNQSVRHILSYNPNSKYYGKTFTNKKLASSLDHSTYGVDFNKFLENIKRVYSSLTSRNWPH